MDALLAAVPLPEPWSCDAWLDALEIHRGRPIDLCARTWQAGQSTGAWARYLDRDVIVFTMNTSPIHQDHIILHEVGHMVSDHCGGCVLPPKVAEELAPLLSEAAFGHLLGHADQVDEAEAETIAAMLLTRISRQERRLRRRRMVSPEDGTTGSLSRLTSIFEQR